jgi:gliding motility-associated-like protein
VKVSDFYQCHQTLSFEIPAGGEGMAIKEDILPISCANEKASITVSVSGGKAPFSYYWSNGKKTERIDDLIAGDYELTVEDANGCSITTSFTIEAFTAMEVSAETHLDLSCADAVDGFIKLEVIGGKAPYTFSWSNGSKTQDLAGLGAGSYGVKVTDSDGCSIEKTFEVSAPEKLQARIETMLDVDCSSGEAKGAAWVSVQGGKAPYTIKWLNGKQTGNEIEFLEENEISVEITDANGCKVTETKSVNYGQVLAADRLAFEFKKLRKVNGGEIEVLDPLQFESLASEEFIAWEWDFGDGSISREKDPVHVYETPGQFEIVLKGYDIFGCSSVQKEKINVQESSKIILIPNAFTPNGDGLNDTFEPKMKAYSFFRMDIFNTWGDLIFSSSRSERLGWDGRVMGQDAPSGSYVYKISLVTDAGESVQESGTLTLIR